MPPMPSAVEIIGVTALDDDGRPTGREIITRARQPIAQPQDNDLPAWMRGQTAIRQDYVLGPADGAVDVVDSVRVTVCGLPDALTDWLRWDVPAVAVQGWCAPIGPAGPVVYTALPMLVDVAITVDRVGIVDHLPSLVGTARPNPGLLLSGDGRPYDVDTLWHMSFVDALPGLTAT